MMDPLVIEDLLERLQEIVNIMNDYEEELYLPLEMAVQLQEELQTMSEQQYGEE